MLLDFEVKASARTCAASGETLQPGDVFFSALELVDGETVRRDYRAEDWQGPPESNLGWWRSRVPEKDEKPKLAPADVMLNLFASLADKPEQQQFRYVLGLLLVRRRLLRREESTNNDDGQEVLILFAPKRDEQYELIVDEPDAEQAEKIQLRMIDLLYGDGDHSIDTEKKHLNPGSSVNDSPLQTRSGAWHLQLCLLVLIVFGCSGATCSRGIRNPFVPLGPPAPEVLLSGSSLDQVIGAVNNNASRIVSYQTNNASITVPGMPGIPLLKGNLVALQPGKVRLRAYTSLTGDEVDMGSNDELFWFWVKRNEPPALYFSRHDQFANSAARQVMPIEPQWLLDALGMMQFSPNDQHTGPFPRGNDTLEIQSTLQTRGGPMTKSTIIDARKAWVLEQHVYDANGTLIASTRAKNHRYFETIGVSIPQDIHLEVPAAELSLSIDVGDVQLNSLIDNPALWSLPAIAPQIDLGTAAPGTVAPIRSAGTHDLGTFASPTTFGIAPPSTNVMPGTPYSAPATPAILPATPAPIVAQPVQPTDQPVAYRLQPGGVALPSTVR